MNMPAFYLQGGFELDKLHGIYKLMMKTMKSTVGKGLSLGMLAGLVIGSCIEKKESDDGE